MSQQQLCAVCGETGQVETIRVLPDHAMMKRATHQSDQEHSWTEYDSIDDIGTPNNTLLLKPKGRVLEECIICHKLGYRYNTHFQHSNEPPIGPRMLRGKQDGWRYRRCYFSGNRRIQKQQQPKQETKIRVKTKIEKRREKSQRNTGFSKKTLIARDLFIELANEDMKKQNPDVKPYIHAALQRTR